ncbi:MAG: hypothetical protein L0H31_09070 [Nocardioidaceae bacterium]|nr:hypothetical protein [Nocardioidaceae bacterium]
MNAVLLGAVSELLEQLGAESPALPFVDDGDGNFGSLGVFGVPDVASDAQAPPSTWLSAPSASWSWWSTFVK